MMGVEELERTRRPPLTPHTALYCELRTSVDSYFTTNSPCCPPHRQLALLELATPRGDVVRRNDEEGVSVSV
jgi:hypothetical protein